MGNTKSKDNYERYKIIDAHSISLEKHEYIKYPTYRYKIYIEVMNEYDVLNNIQLIREDLKNEKCYKNIESLINKINKKKLK